MLILPLYYILVSWSLTKLASKIDEKLVVTVCQEVLWIALLNSISHLLFICKSSGLILRYMPFLLCLSVIVVVELLIETYIINFKSRLYEKVEIESSKLVGIARENKQKIPRWHALKFWIITNAKVLLSVKFPVGSGLHCQVGNLKKV